MSDYAIAAGWNNSAGLVLFDDILGVDFAVRGVPVTDGALDRVTMGGKRYVDGRRDAVIIIDNLLLSILNTIRDDYLGTPNADSEKVTIKTIKQDGTFGTFNAHFYKPTHSKAYEHAYNKTYVNDVRLSFDVVEEI